MNISITFTSAILAEAWPEGSQTEDELDDGGDLKDAPGGTRGWLVGHVVERFGSGETGSRAMGQWSNGVVGWIHSWLWVVDWWGGTVMEYHKGQCGSRWVGAR